MGRQWDLVLVNPGGRARQYQSLAIQMAAIEPPIWAGMMATFVRRHGFNCAILDANAEELGAEEVAARVAEMDPLLTAVVAYGHNPSASTQVMTAAGAICTAIKAEDPRRRVLLVGGHVAALPERTLREEATDYVAGGEGLYALVDLLQALRSTSTPRLELVRDLWYRDGGTLRVGQPAPLLTDLDGWMPGLSWDLLPMPRYRAHNWHCFGDHRRQPYGAIYTTLGCPYRCAFCCIQAPFKRGERVAGYRPEVNSYRLWSPQAVIAQIDLLVTTYGVRNIKLADEMFVLNRRHVVAICDSIQARGYDLNIWAYARVDTVRDTELLATMRGAGVRWLALGIEAASAQVRHGVQKGYRQEEIHRAIERLRSVDINVVGNYIFGLPEDTLETMQETFSLALDLNCEWANFSCTMAYPGSQLYSEALQQGWPLPATWGGYSQQAEETLPLPTRHLSGPEVLRFRDRAFDAYFSSARYLAMLERKFGPATVEHIREMASVKLRRRFN